MSAGTYEGMKRPAKQFHTYPESLAPQGFQGFDRLRGVKFGHLLRRLRGVRENPTAWQLFELGWVLTGCGMSRAGVRRWLRRLGRLYGASRTVVDEALGELEAAAGGGR